jgi:hypothetical protein
MPHFKCLACKTRLRSTEGDAGLIVDLCPVCGSRLESVGDLGELVGYRAIETRGSTSPSGASRAVEMIADRVGEIVARREFKHSRVRPQSNAATLALSVHDSKPLAVALPARATKP